MAERATKGPWASLPASDEWFDMVETLHLWTQVVGKIRMVQSPWLNHSWSVPLYVAPTGLRTSLVPHGTDAFELAFDLLAERLELRTTTGRARSVELGGQTVAQFYAEVMEAMRSVDMPVAINTTPNEIADAIPFPDDTTHAGFDGELARALWRALLDANRVLTRFRAGYLGKASPVHLFWGSFDLAVTRFSGRNAPPHPGGMPNFPDDVAREAYSQEVTSCGFFPGSRDAPDPVFYAYAYPTPEGFADADVGPEAALWLDDLGEFVLPHAAVAAADDPDGMVLAFAESAHAAAADLAGWDRARLECSDPHGPDWWRTRPEGGHDAHVTELELSYRHDPERHRYVVEAEGKTVVGMTVYHLRQGRYVFVHTEVDDDLEGRGAGSALVRFALDDVRAKGASVVALCPFVAGWIDRHPDYADLLETGGTAIAG